MERQFHIMRENRAAFIRLLEELSLEELNETAEGFNNNIAWNFNHMVTVLVALNYQRSGVTHSMPKERMEKYARGTRPQGWIDQEEIDYYKSQAIALVDQFEADWNAGLFTRYEPFTTSLGVSIVNNADSLHYTATHDFLHYGYAMALRRLVKRHQDVR